MLTFALLRNHCQRERTGRRPVQQGFGGWRTRLAWLDNGRAWQRGSVAAICSWSIACAGTFLVVVLAWVYVLLLPLAGAAELAGLIDHAIGRGWQWCLTATLSGRRAGKAGKQAKKLFLRAFPLHQLQRHFFCFGSRPLATSFSPSLLHFNCTIPLAFCSLSQPQHSSAQHRNSSAAPLSQQSSICLRSLTPPSRVREYLAFLFLLLKHDGTRCASSPLRLAM